jgi:hypothetical protein
LGANWNELFVPQGKNQRKYLCSERRRGDLQALFTGIETQFSANLLKREAHFTAPIKVVNADTGQSTGSWG